MDILRPLLTCEAVISGRDIKRSKGPGNKGFATLDWPLASCCEPHYESEAKWVS